MIVETIIDYHQLSLPFERGFNNNVKRCFLNYFLLPKYVIRNTIQNHSLVKPDKIFSRLTKVANETNLTSQETAETSETNELPCDKSTPRNY